MLTKKEVQKTQERLLAMRARVDADFAQHRLEAFRGAGGEAGGGLSNAPLHPADLGSQEFDEGVTLGLVETEANLRQEIEDALDRVRAGKFGTCEACGKTIPKARLNIVPYARHCVPCAESAQ